MNTPEPCDTCKWLTWNVMHEDDLKCTAECILGHALEPCEDYKNWEEKDEPT